MHIKKKIIIILSITLLTICGIYMMSYHQYAKPKYISITRIEVNSENIIVDGFNYGGMFNYLGYKTKYEGGDLYVAFRGGWHMPWMPETNCTAFYPIPNTYENLNKIYLTDSLFNNPRLVWTSTSSPEDYPLGMEKSLPSQ